MRTLGNYLRTLGIYREIKIVLVVDGMESINRRGGDYLVMATLAERSHPWINKVRASRAGVGIRIIRLLVASAGM